MNIEEEVKQLARRVSRLLNEELPSGVTAEDISSFEKRTGLIMPISLREWLSYTNGPCIGPGGILGVQTRRDDLDIEEILSSYPKWGKNAWVPIAGDGCGNYYLLNTRESGGIYFIDTSCDMEHLAYAVASGFWRFLRFLFEEELGEKRWPFTKDYVISCDPDIEKCKAAPLPWNA